MTWKDKIITSDKSKEMLGYILPFYDDDEYIMYLFESLGIEYDRLSKGIDTFLDQPFPERSTWSLDYWEQLFGLPNSGGKSISERRKSITDFINAKQPINKDRIEVIVSGITNGKVIVQEFIKNYTFHVVLVSDDLSVINREIWKTVYDSKPAHLSVKYYVKIGNNLYFYDIEKKTIAPVSKFYSNVGKGYTNNPFVNVATKIRIGMFFPMYSGEIQGGKKVKPPQSRNKTTEIGLMNSESIGTATLKNSPMRNEQKSLTYTVDLNANVDTKYGMSIARYCGMHYAGEGVT